MSDYATAVLAKGQALITKKYQEPEQRRKMPTVFELALKNQDYSIPDAQVLRTSPLRPVDVNFFTNVVPGTATAKAYNHTGTYGDSGKVNLVYVSMVETMSIPRKIGDNNFNSYQAIFNNLYEMKWKNLRDRHDNAALAFLYANRCQLGAGAIAPSLASANAGTWNPGTFALEISQADKQLFIQRVKSAMSSRYFAGDLDIIADLQLGAGFDYASQQGAGNFANIQYQFAGTTIAVTQAIVDPAYALGAVLALPKGMYAGLNWNEALNRRGVDAGTSDSIGILGTIKDPLGSGAIADLSMYTQRADTSANTTGGSTQDIVDQWELTLTIGYALPPLSAASDSVVMEFGQSA